MSTDKNPEAGFSLVEVMVSLTVIALGIVGTLSMVGANRALMESTWDVARMRMIADSVMAELAVRSQRGETLPAVGTYNWTSDPSGLSVLFTDNGYTASASSLTVASSSQPGGVIDVTLRVTSPTGRTMTRERSFYEELKTP